MATRTEGRAAMVSSISMSCAASAVVTALSACGRLSVMTAMRASETYSTSTSCSGSAWSSGGR